MSFGEGNLREQLAKASERAEMYRRQLGGMTSALRRERQHVRELELENRQLREEADQLAQALGHYQEVGA